MKRLVIKYVRVGVLFVAALLVALLWFDNMEEGMQRVGIVDKEHVFARPSVALMIRGQAAKTHRAKIRCATKMLRNEKDIEGYIANNKYRLTEEERQKLNVRHEQMSAEARRIRQQVEDEVQEEIKAGATAYADKSTRTIEIVAQNQQLGAVFLKTDPRAERQTNEVPVFIEIADHVIKELIP